ncbi:hypothetical protein EV702DRAFT_1198252 [Suillus placidus]|uniref:Uncharacterized protein n=1 Tax=Suillus placidus TaxID=48579 RepID=A0A9P6ZU55_9AGAM|nr:hypothetical protein EV702DRAFT_1198252 [Suillus placidus]
MTVLSANESNVSRAPVLDLNLNNTSEGHFKDNEPELPTVEEYVWDDINVADAYNASNVFFVHPTSIKEPPTYSDSSASLLSVFPHTPPNSNASLVKSNEFMPSLLPSHFFESKLNSSTSTESDVRGSRAVETDDDVPMNHLSETPEVPTDGTIPYHGLSHADGKSYITFEGLTKSEAKGISAD